MAIDATMAITVAMAIAVAAVIDVATAIGGAVAVTWGRNWKGGWKYSTADGWVVDRMKVLGLEVDPMTGTWG